MFILQNPPRWRAFSLTVLVLGVVWTLASRIPAQATTDGAPPPSPREGFSAPDFTLTTLAGDEVTLSGLRGSVVVVNLWASWCGPCRAEMPILERIHQRYGAQGLVILAVNAADQDSETAARNFVSENGLTFPILLDYAGEASRSYQLRALPSTFFVDKRGVIRAVVFGGPMAEAVIQSNVEDLLAEAP